MLFNSLFYDLIQTITYSSQSSVEVHKNFTILWNLLTSFIYEAIYQNGNVE